MIVGVGLYPLASPVVIALPRIWSLVRGNSKQLESVSATESQITLST